MRDVLVSDPNAAAAEGVTMLIFAAQSGCAPMVTQLLADKRVDPNVTDRMAPRHS